MGTEDENPASKMPRVLRAAALMVALPGAGASVGLMLMVGRHQPSRLLLTLFTLWVLSPFASAALALLFFKRWTGRTGAGLSGVLLILTPITLAIYGYAAFGPARSKPAALFLMVPLASWVVIGAVVAIGARKFPGSWRKRTR
jgi:hypothetical protein